MKKKNQSIVAQVSASLNQPDVNLQELLSYVISAFDCTTGTIHFLDTNTRFLKLQAYEGIPAFLLPKLEEIPIGKGMAGIAAERREPVEMCNLQTDNSGVARPAAKETKVEGSIAVPMLLEGSLYGVFGVAKPVPYDFSEEEIGRLMEIGKELGRYVRSNQ